MKDYNNIPFKNAAIDRLTSMTTIPNRGDRMVARGENKMAKANAKIDKRIMGAEEKASEKVRKLSNKFGEAPKYNQSQRLDKAKSKLKSAESDTDHLMWIKNRDPEPLSQQNFFNDNRDLKNKFAKGKGLVKKGEMLSKHINAKRK